MKDIALKILSHPDKDEVIAKLLMEISAAEINEWLKAKYNNQKELILSKKILITFKDEYLDIYSAIREDLLKLNTKQLAPADELKLEIQSNTTYKKLLEEYVDNEIDIKTIIKNMVVAIQFRLAQVFDQIQEDPRNMKMDNTIIDLFDTLTKALEKYDPIINGSPEQINIQNNINIQLVDKHINVIYTVIKEILSQLDYESSLLFTELFTKRLSELKEDIYPNIAPEKRLEEVQSITNKLSKKLEN